MGTYGAWRSYLPGYLASDEAEITTEVLDQMLSIMGFKSLESLRDEIGQQTRGEFSSDLSKKLRLLMKGAEEKPTKDLFWMSDELSASIYNPITGDTESVEFKNPFILAKDPANYLVEITALSVEEVSSGLYSVNFRGGISCERLFESSSEKLDPICNLISSGLLANALDPDTESAQFLASIEEWLRSDNSYCGKIGVELLEEIEFQCKTNIENMGICVSGLHDEDGEEVEFYTESSDEEIGFM